MITIYPDMFLLGFILPGTFCTSLTWVTVSFSMLGKLSDNTYANIFSLLLLSPFSCFSFKDSYNVNVDAFNVVPEVSETVLISFHCSLFSSAAVISTIVSFFISVIVLFICFFFLSRCLLNISFIFFICASTLFQYLESSLLSLL